MKPILEWTLRDWFEYHQRHVHQGYYTGHTDLQQRWMGRNIFKNPLDCWIYQEIVYETQPDIVIELGVAYGGSLLYMSSLLRLIDKPSAQLIGVDVDVSHATDLKIPGLHLIQGTCQDENVIKEVSLLARGRRTMLIADCDHEKAHVLNELSTYSSLVSIGCYYIIEDGVCDVMNWSPTTGQSVEDSPVAGPRAAAKEFLSKNKNFVDDAHLREKYLITYNFNGYLRRVL